MSLRWVGRAPGGVAPPGPVEAWPGGVAAHPSLQHHMQMRAPLDITLSELVGAGHGANPGETHFSLPYCRIDFHLYFKAI